MNVFVYGTLRKYESNHSLLEMAELVAEHCRVRGRLYDTGHGYPAMVPDDNAWTYGEMYRITEEQLEKLDWLEDYYGEGQDNEYNRVVMKVQTKRGFEDAYVYTYSEDQVKGLKAIESGDWRASRPPSRDE